MRNDDCKHDSAEKALRPGDVIGEGGLTFAPQGDALPLALPPLADWRLRLLVECAEVGASRARLQERNSQLGAFLSGGGPRRAGLDDSAVALLRRQHALAIVAAVALADLEQVLEQRLGLP